MTDDHSEQSPLAEVVGTSHILDVLKENTPEESYPSAILEQIDLRRGQEILPERRLGFSNYTKSSACCQPL